MNIPVLTGIFSYCQLATNKVVALGHLLAGFAFRIFKRTGQRSRLTSNI